MSNKCNCQIPNTDIGGRCFKCGGFVEMPISKPMTPQERIKADAERFTKDEGYQKVYIAGATAEHEKIEAAIDSAIHKERNALQAKVTQMDMDWLKRAQVLVDALNIIGNGPFPITQKELEEWLLKTKAMAREAIEQWKSGKGKEVGDE